MHDPPDLSEAERVEPERLLDLTGQGEAPDFGLVLHASRLGSPADRDRAAEVLIDTAVGTYLEPVSYL
jgi:hypothetical protein